MATDSDAEARLFASRVLGQTRTPDKIGTLLGDASAVDASVIRRRWGIVAGINDAARTVDVRLDGVILPALPRVTWYRPMIGETVMVEVSRTDAICAGPVGLSPNNVFALEGHSHAGTGRAAPAVLKYASPVSLTQEGGFFVDLGADSVNADVVDIDLGSAVTLGGFGVMSGTTAADGQFNRFSFKAHDKNRAVTLRTERDGDWSIPGDGFANPITVEKDTTTIGVTRYNAQLKRWMIEDVKRGHKVLSAPRPTVVSRASRAGTGTTLGLAITPSAAGQLLVLLHCNDFGYWGEMRAPSGTIGPGDWTFVGGGGTDFKSHINCWVARAPQSGYMEVYVNQAYVFATFMTLCVLANAGTPQSSDYVWKTDPNATLAPTSSSGTRSSYNDALLLSTFMMENAASVSNYPTGWNGADLDGTAAPVTPQSETATDANGSYATGWSAMRYIAGRGLIPQMSLTLNAAQSYTQGNLLVPGA